jgi:hypothetical protein
MDGQNIRDRQMVERYLQGRLTADEEQAFEEAYLSDPALLDELKLTETLRDGLRREAVAGRAGPTAAVAGARDGPWRRAFASVPYAAAATVLLGVSLTLSGVLVVENRRLEQAGSDAAAARILTLVSVRGSDAANRIDTPRAGEISVLAFDAGFGDYADYRVTLTRAGDAADPLVQLGGLVPSYDGEISIGVPSSALTPGNYEISLEGRGSAADGAFEPVTRIPLTVVPTE